MNQEKIVVSVLLQPFLAKAATPALRSVRVGLVMIGLALACDVSAAKEVFPGKTWEQREPAQMGLDAAKLDKLAGQLGGRGCVVKDGYVVKTWGDQAQVADWLSSAKPVLSTMLFFAIEEGKVRNVDQPIADFGWELMEKDRSMTFRHLATMTSGYARPEVPGAAWAYNDYGIQLYFSPTTPGRVCREHT